jgi:parvulin-like peptidyl-prolyl isomerase
MQKRLLLSVCLALAACGGPSVASVNGDKISVKDFARHFRVAATQNDAVWLQQPARAIAFKEKLLNDLIDEALLLQETRRLGITATDAELAEEYARYKSQYTEAIFQDMLKAKGISYDEWKDDRRRSYIIDKLRDMAAPDAAKIKESELKAFYDQNIVDFRRPEEVHVRQILVGTADTARMVHAKLLTGDNFAALAQQYSISPDAKQGGDIGYFARGTFPPVFDKVCFALPVGGVSDVVKSDYGYQIFKVLDHRPARTIPFPEAKKLILRSLKQEGGQKQFDTLLVGLRHHAKIKIDAKTLSKIEVPHATDAPDTDSH